MTEPLLPTEKGATWGQQREIVEANLQALQTRVARLEDAMRTIDGMPGPLTDMIEQFCVALAEQYEFRRMLLLWAESNQPRTTGPLTDLVNVLAGYGMGHVTGTSNDRDVRRTQEAGNAGEE